MFITHRPTVNLQLHNFDQWRRKQFESGRHKASAEREPIRGSGGGAPSGVQGQSPWSGGQGWRSPPEAKKFLGIICRKDRQYLPLYPTFESAEISPKHCLESKYRKKHTPDVCVNRLNCRTRSASDVQNHTVRSHYLAIISEQHFFSAWPVVRNKMQLRALKNLSVSRSRKHD